MERPVKLSIIVPTYNEAKNLPLLVEKIALALADVKFEILIMDDQSEDGTRDVCRLLTNKYPLRLIVSSGRARDLSLSVCDGIASANASFVIVMDADLSHPPDMINVMLDEIVQHPSSFIIGSRYIKDGSFDRNWSIWRFINSYFATLIARPLVNCSDPMSGFFIFNKSRVELSKLSPIGYKIGLELMVRGQFDRIQELPIQFKDREVGESKMNLDQQLKYLRHLRRLYLYKFGNLAEFVHFGFVGASGFLVDIAFYYSLQVLGFPHLVARALSFLPAVSWNWILNRLTTFGERKKRPKARQWIEFVVTGVFGFALNYGVYAALTTKIEFFDEYRILGLIAGVACGSIFNFGAASLFVYSEKRK